MTPPAKPPKTSKKSSTTPADDQLDLLGGARRPDGADDEIAALEKEIRRHNALYWDHETPEISDYAYDALVVKLRKLAPSSPLLLEMGPSRKAVAAKRAAASTDTSPPPITRAPDPKATFGTPFRHRAPMLSLDKCYTDEELLAFVADVEGDVLAMPKFDGVACSIHYDADGELAVAATRGDGTVGDDVTANVLRIADVPKKLAVPRGRREPHGPLEVRGEIYMKLSAFETWKEGGMANPRNLAAGAVKMKDSDKSASYGLSFAAYDLLGLPRETQAELMTALVDFGFPPVENVVLPKSRALEGYARFAKERPTLDFEIDGVVYKVDSLKEQRLLGETAHHPRYAIAYKFQGDAGVTTLREVEWSVARTGAITPVAIVDPIALSGVTVTRASLHNVAFIAKLGLTLGAKVTLVRRGGVIPNVEFVTEPGTEPVVVPTTCPSCGSPVTRERDFLYCTTPRTCPRAVVGQLAHFAATTDMLGFGDVLLEQAHAKGLLRSPADFYRLDVEGLKSLERSGEKLAQKLVAEVDKKRTLELATFLRALGIGELGKHVSGILADRYRTLDAVLAVTEEELAAIHSIGASIAKSVVAGLAEDRATIDALAKVVTITHGTGNVEGGPLSGKSFVFTGKMVHMGRSEAEKKVRSLGGAVLSAVSKQLDYLVVGDDKSGPKSTKEKAADKILTAGGAPLKVIAESEFLKLIGG
ncbi:MAG: NAD-dependent DNA ligase LigA [Polyangiaceae bacterium]